MNVGQRVTLRISRYGEIISVFLKYGFEDVIAGLNLQKDAALTRLPFHFKRRTAFKAPLSRWERVRLAIEELGPTFIKFGQFLSNRPDLVPAELIDELIKLQDSVKPFSRTEALAILEHALKRPVGEVFADFPAQPIASASVAQVYRARLKNGDDVAIKVQRPNIRRIVATDLDILGHLAGLIERHNRDLAALHLSELVREFGRTLNKELDFSLEAATMERFRADFKNTTEYYVPKVYAALTTESVLVIEFVDGIKVSDVDSLKKAGLVPSDIARVGVNLVLRQIFTNGFFHADPHPGNILVLPDGRLCFLDYGAVGIVSASLRHHLSVILYGVIYKDPQRIMRTLSQLATQRIVNIDRLEYEITEIIEQYSSASLSEIKVRDLLDRFGRITAENHLRFVPGFYLLFKALITIEGVGLLLDPAFNLAREVEPYARRLMRENPRLRYLPFDVYFTLADMASLLKDLPFEVKDLMRMLKAGETRIQFEHRGLDSLSLKLDQIVNRMVFAIVLAALIIGSSVVIHSGMPPLLYGVPLVGVLGFAIAGLLALWLLFSMLKTNHS
ncbi:MAG: AarF/ABC1/UbiB kinase family protein [Chitinivibrionales bacterium]